MERGQYYIRMSTYCQSEQKQDRNTIRNRPQWATEMAVDPENQPASEPDRLEAATDEAIAACGDARDAVKALGQ